MTDACIVGEMACVGGLSRLDMRFGCISKLGRYLYSQSVENLAPHPLDH